MNKSIWHSPLQRREAIEGYLWISPWLIGFVVLARPDYCLLLSKSYQIQNRRYAALDWLGKLHRGIFS